MLKHQMRYILQLLCLFWLSAALCLGISDSFLEWSISEAVKLLNESAWARTETFTQVIGGIGSGVSGEKEIYNSFYVRFLSARPIREAYTRVQMIQHGYDQSSDDQRRQLRERIGSRLDQDFSCCIVLAVSFRSNDPNEESRVRQYFMSQTTGTLMNKAFLSTDQFSQVRLAAYFPPREEGVGGRFVFPRTIDGKPVVSSDDGQITFELTETPAAKSIGAQSGEEEGGGRRGRGGGRGRRGRSQESEQDEDAKSGTLRATFSVKEMVVDGALIL